MRRALEVGRLTNWRAALGVLFAILWLHVVSVLPLQGGLSRLVGRLDTPSPDLILLVALAVVGGAARRPRLVSWLLALVLIVLLLFRAGNDVTIQAFERALVIDDLPYVPNVLRMWWESQDASLRLWLAAFHVAKFLVALWLTARSFRTLAVRAAQARFAVIALLVLQLLAIVAVADAMRTDSRPPRWRPSDALSLVDELVRWTRTAIDPSRIDAPIRSEIAAGIDRMAAAPADLERLAGVDVHLLVIESYGRMALRHPQLAPHFRDLWREFDGSLRTAGFRARSGSVAPTVRGGGSWLMHAELLTSVRVAADRVWKMVLASDIVPFTRRVGSAGHRVVEVMPAMNIHWPEGEAFYGIDVPLMQADLDYQGHPYPFAHMPDQFALHHVLERVVKPADQPLFVSFISATSHAPWRWLPPYIADWQIDARTFQAQPKDSGRSYDDVFAQHPEVLPAYRDSIEYALRCAVGYTERLTRPSLVIIMGDHQPAIARSFPPIDESTDVPVHMLSNRPELLDALASLGWADGVDVPDGLKSLPLVYFAPTLLRLYSK